MVRLPLDKGARGIFHIYTEMLNPKESVLCAAAYGIDTFVTPGATGGVRNYAGWVNPPPRIKLTSLTKSLTKLIKKI